MTAGTAFADGAENLEQFGVIETQMDCFCQRCICHFQYHREQEKEQILLIIFATLVTF